MTWGSLHAALYARSIKSCNEGVGACCIPIVAQDVSERSKGGGVATILVGARAEYMLYPRRAYIGEHESWKSKLAIETVACSARLAEFDRNTGDIASIPSPTKLAMTDTQDASLLGDNVKVEMTNPKLKTKLSEYGRRNKRTDGPYKDNLECDALIVGGGFAGVFMFWSLKNAGLDVVMYEAGTDLGGTWRWNCYREYCQMVWVAVIVADTVVSRSHGRL